MGFYNCSYYTIHLVTKNCTPDNISPAKNRNNKRCSILGPQGSSSKSINVGPQYQTEIPPLISDVEPITKQLSPSNFDSECFWRPDENLVNSEFLKEYCNVAQKHQGLAIDEVFYHFYPNLYFIPTDLHRLGI